MKNHYLALSVLFLFGLLQGCSAAAPDQGALIGRWQVQRIAAQALPLENGPTLTFDIDNRAHGNGGCNLYQGSYEIQGEKLALGPMAANRKACPVLQMDSEQLFFGNLAKVTSYHLEGNILKLRARDGDNVVVLRRAK